MSRPLKVGVQLPEVEREVRWNEILDMARAIEDLGYDSLWLGEHLLYRWPDREPRGPWEAWAMLAALAAVTTRVELGPLVACTAFHNPAVLAKRADTIDEISGGRLILGLGAGWNETEFRAFGIPFDHRIDRFEEAFTIIRSLLRDGAVDFEGTYYSARDCELLPRGPRPGGPPLMIGSTGPRMLRITMPHVNSWNAWYADTQNSPAGVARSQGDRRRGVHRGRARPGTGRTHGGGPGPAAGRHGENDGRHIHDAVDQAARWRRRGDGRGAQEVRPRRHRPRPTRARSDLPGVDRAIRTSASAAR